MQFQNLLKLLLIFIMLCSRCNAESFDSLWMGRIARPPLDGTASIYSNGVGSRGNRLSGIYCAHPTERFGQILVVINKESRRRVFCPVLDKGPFVKGRAIDLSKAAGKAIGCDGLCEVWVYRDGYE